MEGYHQGGVAGRMGEKVQVLRAENRQGKVKNSIGNGEVKELICTAHGHELRQEYSGWRWGAKRRRVNWGKNGKTVIE